MSRAPRKPSAASLANLDRDRDATPGGSLPAGYGWSSEGLEDTALPPYIVRLETGERVADTAAQLRELLAGVGAHAVRTDAQADDAQADDAQADDAQADDAQADDAQADDAQADDAQADDAQADDAQADDAQSVEQLFRVVLDFSHYVQPGMTVMFREHQRRFNGLLTTPAIVTRVHEDRTVNLMVLPDGGEPYPRLNVPYEQELTEDGVGRAWTMARFTFAD